MLDVMRKFNLSYSVSGEQEFIPALCDSETPQELHPSVYRKQISYQMKYTYLPDSVVHQLMIRSYKNLNPDKIWRKGLRIDIDWLGLSAVVDMGNDDSTLRLDIYASGTVEPWKLLHNIREDISAINRILGLTAEDYIIIHEGNEDIPKTVNELLKAKEQGLNPLPVYNPATESWKTYEVDALLGMTFGEEVMSAAVKKAQEEERSLTSVLPYIKIDALNLYQQPEYPDALRIIEILIQNHCETNVKLLECLVDALVSADDESARDLAEEIKQTHSEKKNFLKQMEKKLKTVASVFSSGKTIYSGTKAVAEAVQTAYPQILELMPELAEDFQTILH